MSAIAKKSPDDENLPALPDLTVEEARRITDEIKTHLEAGWELVVRAYTERAWAALDYESWDAYCIAEFGSVRLRLPREERSEMVCSLRQAGLSIRAIASATGLSQPTVSRELAGDSNESPDEPTDVDAESDALAEELIDDVGMAPVLGLDGKKYTPKRPIKINPKPRQRTPITTTASSLSNELRKIADRVEKILADDRLAKNKDGVATHLRHHLARTITACQSLDQIINNNTPPESIPS